MKQVALPLAITLLMQMMISAVNVTVPVLAPVLTAEAGIAPERIGYLTSISVLGTLWLLMINRQIMPRTGPLRLLQFGNLMAAIGLLMMLFGHWGWMLIGMMFMGMGYGPTPPCGSQILAKATPDRIRGLVFSIKQSGVPIGAALTGLASPWLADAFGWRVAILAVAGAMILAVLSVQPWRKRFDAERKPEVQIRPLSLISPKIFLEPASAVRGVPGLISLTYAGASFAIVQGSVFAFLVTYLVDDIKLSLAAAGFAFATLQVVGSFARVANGMVSDLIRSGRRTLILLSVLSAVMSLVLSAIQPDWSTTEIVAACGFSGLAIAAWNGVYLAEIARVAPPERVADVTAGSTFFTFVGYVIGPSAFGAIVQITGGYETSLRVIAGLVLVAGLVLWLGDRKSET
ncbi:MAG: MFS transporter [Rhodospirillaceae bacterium]|jgi:MFS family permease|nr:MFS transporter [Rhodospirillaceae bacterium]MBT6139113.1 MFS transporter [Rhodospirillaceae bacterium]